MSQQPAAQRTAEWANARDLESTRDDNVIDLTLRHGAPLEVGAWSLEYLGPGFHVQLRIARRNREARVDGWMSPARPITVFLSTLHQGTVLEAQVSDSGRFEFPVAPSGACRMSFAADDFDRNPATPPFWI